MEPFFAFVTKQFVVQFHLIVGHLFREGAFAGGTTDVPGFVFLCVDFVLSYRFGAIELANFCPERQPMFWVQLSI